MKRETFRADDLKLIKRAEPRLHPPGSLVRLNSCGPVGIVQDLQEDDRCLVRMLHSGEIIVMHAACWSPA